MTCVLRYSYSIVLLFVALQLSAQKKFIGKIDTNYTPNELLLDKTTICSGTNELNPYEVDYDLLNCLIIQEINVYRKKKSLTKLEYSEKLDGLAQNYLNYYNRSSFIHNSGNKIRLNRPIKKAAKKLNYNNGLINAIIYQKPLIHVAPRTDYFFYPSGEHPPVNLYYGLKPTENQVAEGYFFNTIKLFTYQQFVKRFFKDNILRHYARVINDKALRQIGCRCYVIEQTLNKNTVPAANFMIITGAPRLELIPKTKN